MRHHHSIRYDLRRWIKFDFWLLKREMTSNRKSRDGKGREWVMSRVINDLETEPEPANINQIPTWAHFELMVGQSEWMSGWSASQPAHLNNNLPFLPCLASPLSIDDSLTLDWISGRPFRFVPFLSSIVSHTSVCLDTHTHTNFELKLKSWSSKVSRWAEPSRAESGRAEQAA